MQETEVASCIRKRLKSLKELYFSRHPQPRKMLVAKPDSLWRIGWVGLKVKSHGAVHFHHRRRGLFPRKGSGFSGARRSAAGARLQGPPSQTRSLSESRSRHDVAVSAWRSVRDR